MSKQQNSTRGSHAFPATRKASPSNKDLDLFVEEKRNIELLKQKTRKEKEDALS